jgi:putative N6-adenine-specific DNA methylase
MELNSTSHFGLTVTPGLEDIAIYELNLLWNELNEGDLPEIERKKGKLYINCQIKEICDLIPFLRVPTQIYLQVASFTSKDTTKLFKRISKIKWADYLRGENFVITASAKESRIINTSVIKEKTLQAIELSAKHNPIKSAPNEYREIRNKIHTDIYKDNVKVELSLCGERLDKRGLKLNSDIAPIRESIAAAMLYKLSEFEKDTLRDPMCGSGTFTTEALNLLTYNNHRKYDYINLPFYIKLPLSKRKKIDTNLFSKVFSSDIEQAAIVSTKKNVEKCKTNVESEMIGVEDFFNCEDLDRPYSLVLNPPYGKRIKLEEGLDLYLKKIIKKSKDLKNLKYLCLIFPKWAASALSSEKIEYTTTLSNGGIDVQLVIIQIH